MIVSLAIKDVSTSIDLSKQGSCINGKLVSELEDGGYKLLSELMMDKAFVEISDNDNIYFISTKHINFLKVAKNHKEPIKQRVTY